MAQKAREAEELNQKRIMAKRLKRFDETAPDVVVGDVLRVADAAGLSAMDVSRQVKRLEHAIAAANRQRATDEDKAIAEYARGHAEEVRNHVLALAPLAKADALNIVAEPPACDNCVFAQMSMEDAACDAVGLLNWASEVGKRQNVVPGMRRTWLVL